jgi:hypothetical protein
MTQQNTQPDATQESALEQALTALEQDPSATIVLSDSDVARIVGGAYVAAIRTTLSVAAAALPARGDDNCGPGSCHPACNSWCHDFKP